MLNKKTIKKFLTFSLFIFMTFNLNAADSYFDKSEKTVVCKEPLPIFTLGENSNPSNKQVRTLCSCVWNEFPTTGWERETSEKIRTGIVIIAVRTKTSKSSDGWAFVNSYPFIGMKNWSDLIIKAIHKATHRLAISIRISSILFKFLGSVMRVLFNFLQSLFYFYNTMLCKEYSLEIGIIHHSWY